MTDHDDELNHILDTTESCSIHRISQQDVFYNGTENSLPVGEGFKPAQNFEQWATSDGKIFIPAAKTLKELIPGCYEIMSCPSTGIYFEKIPVKTEGLLRFPQTNSEKVVKEIQKFWEREKWFRRFDLAYKRGIILWGPPGSGKSSTLQLIMNDVINRGGVVIKFGYPKLFIEGMRILRQIQPTIPIIVLMEDMDSIIESFTESDVLNILDGVDQVDRTIFLATTNYPEKLGPRIINRPSRFDKRFKIDHPNAESRKMYLEYIIGKNEDLNIDVDKWVADTEKFSLAHLKELFVAVVILGDEYKNALKSLRSMKESISSDNDREYVGFHQSRD